MENNNQSIQCRQTNEMHHSKRYPPTCSLLPGTFYSIGTYIGGIVRCIMSLDMPIFFRTNPLQLSILLPTVEARSPWADFLLSIGYTLKRSGRCSYMFAMSCRYNELYESVSDLRTCHMLPVLSFVQSGRGRTVSVTHSAHHTILPALLTSESTAQCFMMTGARLYCLYPQLFEDNEYRHTRFVRRSRQYRPIDWFGLGLLPQIRDDTQLSDTPCGEDCHIRWRPALPSNGISGIQSIQWGGMDANSTLLQDDRLVEDSQMLWKKDVGNCDNRLCPNFGSSYGGLNNPRYWST